MRSAIGWVAVLTVAVPCGADDGDAAKKELKALEGTWKAVAMEAGGTALPKDGLPEFTFTVGEGGKATVKSPFGEEKATMVVDPAKTPRTVDIKHESGNDKGKTQYGVYKIDGDKWTVCATPPGAQETDRPKGFDTKGTANVTFTFERQKAEKK